MLLFQLIPRSHFDGLFPVLIRVLFSGGDNRPYNGFIPTCRGARTPVVFPVCARYSRIRNGAEKLFFLQKVFLFEIFPRKISNSLFKNAPCGTGVPLSAESVHGALPPVPPRFFEKNRVKLLSCGVATANLFALATQTVLFCHSFCYNSFSIKKFSKITPHRST